MPVPILLGMLRSKRARFRTLDVPLAARNRALDYLAKNYRLSDDLRRDFSDEILECCQFAAECRRTLTISPGSNFGSTWRGVGSIWPAAMHSSNKFPTSTRPGERAYDVPCLKPIDRPRVDRVAAPSTPSDGRQSSIPAARFIAGRLFHWASGLLPPQLLQRLRFQCASGINSRQLRARFQAPAISWPPWRNRPSSSRWLQPSGSRCDLCMQILP
jgi:hypothetical protein